MNPTRRVLFHRLRYTTANYSTTTTTTTRATTTRKPSKSKFPKPTEIPFQPKLANSVNLIGTVNKPIHFQTSPDDDGNPSAATVITRLGHDSSQFLIPLVFHGDLAHTANFHLKLNDVVHVEGQLCTHHDQTKLDKSQEYQFQVKVQSLNFVEGYPRVKKAAITSKEKLDIEDESRDDEIKSSEKDIHFEKTEEHDTRKSWKDVINKPSQWKVVHSTKESPKNADFESKTEGELQPELKQSTKESPKNADFESKTEGELQPELKQSTTSAKKYPDTLPSPWGDLLNDPKKWWDFRDSKHNGSVNPKYPDFKRKDGKASIWLKDAPKLVLSRLKEVEFDTPPAKSKQTKDGKGDESWNDLVQNPAKWWDNRLDKKNPRAPDFKHKDTGVVLWLSDSPSWVSSRLKELEVDSTAVEPKQVKDSKGDESWNDLVQNPAKWWDNRLDKKNPRAPDFKHKDTGVGLWLKDSPSWVSSRLKELEVDSFAVKPKQVKDSKGDESWNDLLQNPAKWWDNRLDKKNPKSPDFKHKDTGVGLWLSDSPSWVSPKLPPLKPKQQSAETSWKQTPA